MKFPCRSLLNIPSHLFLTNESTNSCTEMKWNSFYWMFTFVKQFLLMKERRCICTCNFIESFATKSRDHVKFRFNTVFLTNVNGFQGIFQGHTVQMNEPHLHLPGESGIRIRSPEWKFLNTLCIRNRVDANSGFIIHSKIFPWFWLAKSTRIIHHNQLLMTKFGRILCLTRKWRQKCSVLAG